MRSQRRTRRAALAGALAVWLSAVGPLRAENIDPGNEPTGKFQHSWHENTGWVNAEPLGNGGPGVQVEDFRILGWMWRENTGWISLSCENTASCADVPYKVEIDCNTGALRGWAWGENEGWVSFSCLNTASCADVDYKVQIDPVTGDFSGWAWGENTGWISFSCLNTGSCASVDFRVKTAWTKPLVVPAGVPSLHMTKSGADTLLSWTGALDASAFDIVRGSLKELVASGGNYAAAGVVLGCVVDNQLGSSYLFGGTPLAGQGWWFLVRGANCVGHGSYDDGSAVPGRDAEIAASGGDCP